MTLLWSSHVDSFYFLYKVLLVEYDNCQQDFLLLSEGWFVIGFKLKFVDDWM